MKKTIALIISVILVVALFASCTSSAENITATDVEAIADVIDMEDESDADINDAGEENLEDGFYLEGNPTKLTVGSKVPKHSKLSYVRSNGHPLLDEYYVHNGSNMVKMQNEKYDSGDNAYTVKEIGTHSDSPAIYLRPENTKITPGFYIVRENNEPAFKYLKEGMIIPRHTEVALIDKNENDREPFNLSDDNNDCLINKGEVYNSGNSKWEIQTIQLTPNKEYKGIIVLTAPR